MKHTEKDSTELAFSREGKKLKVAGSALGILAGASLFLTGLIVYFFIGYLERREVFEIESLRRIEDQNNKVSQMRIDQCHELQDRMIISSTNDVAALQELNDLLLQMSVILDNQTNAMERLTSRIERMEK